jgi:hypothetical protein
MLGLSDYVNFISMVKGSNTQEVVKYKEYNSSYLNEDLNNEGYLDI